MLGEKSWIYSQLHAVHGVPGRWLCQKMCGNGGQNIQNNSEVIMRQLLAKFCPARRRGQPDVCLRSNLISLSSRPLLSPLADRDNVQLGLWPLTRHPHSSTRPRTPPRLSTAQPRKQQPTRCPQTFSYGIHLPTLQNNPLDSACLQFLELFRVLTDACHSRPPGCLL
jgi:hypothetical protein